MCTHTQVYMHTHREKCMYIRTHTLLGAEARLVSAVRPPSDSCEMLEGFNYTDAYLLEAFPETLTPISIL